MNRRSFLKSAFAATVGAGLVSAIPAPLLPPAQPLAEALAGPVTFKALTLEDINRIAQQVLNKMAKSTYWQTNPFFEAMKNNF